MTNSILLSAVGACAVAASAHGQLFVFTDASGLGAEAEFTLINPTTVGIRLKNTSTGVPGGFSNADQILTGVSWDSGLLGCLPGDPDITGGSVVIGPTSMSLNFDTGSYGPGFDVSGEWGFGNDDGTGALCNMISCNTALTTPFGGANLDGPVEIDGPQGGLVSNPEQVPLGGLGAIQDEVLITFTLDQAIGSLSALTGNGVRVEFGSDAYFITVPAPASVLALGLLAVPRRRR